VENKPESSLVVPLGKALDWMPLPLSKDVGRKIPGRPNGKKTEK